ncbi:MAG: flavodoxin family protein [Mailhella sp.]|nr:flavodoxin family protein [Mailhella sp.]
MKVILLNGSPHQNGCTYTALRECADTLNAEGIESEIVWLGNKPLQTCLACGKCKAAGKCVFDDVVNEIAAKMDGADGLIVGSPVHYSGASSQTVTVMNRLFFSACPRFYGKFGASVVSCRRGGASATFEQLNQFFTICSMPIVPSQYWNQVHGFTPEDVRKDLEGMQTMRTLARNMAWLVKCVKAGENAGITKPVREPAMITNFIR